MEEEPYFEVRREKIGNLPVSDLSLLSVSRDRRKILGKHRGDLWIMNADGTKARQLTSGQQIWFAVFSPDNTRVLYSAYRGNPKTWHLWSESVQPGRSASDVTGDNKEYCDNRIFANCWSFESPRDVVFVRKESEGSGGWDVWNLGSGTQVTRTGDVSHCSWDPSGKRITCIMPDKHGVPSLWVMDPIGHTKRLILQEVSKHSSFVTAKPYAWSPKGSEIACWHTERPRTGPVETQGRGIWVVNVDRGDRRLVVEGWAEIAGWLKSNLIVYRQYEEDDFLRSVATVWATTPDGSKRQRLALPYREMLVAPDGRDIFYCGGEWLWKAEVRIRE